MSSALFAGPFDDLLGKLFELSTIRNFKLGKAGQAAKDSRECEELVLRSAPLLRVQGDGRRI
jgi:hypothetical protein